MIDYTLAIAKRDFQLGYLKEFRIQKSILSEYWNVYLISSKMTQGFLIDAREKKPREFCTIDAAVKAIEQIGFKVGYLSMN